MSGSATIIFKDKGLKKLIEALSGKAPMASVGVLGNKNGRDGEGTNAAIGAKFEFGDAETVRRSFLRVPLTDNLQKYLQEAGLFDEDMFKKMLQTGSLVDYVKKIGIVGVSIVLDGFATGGFGKWKPSIMTYKKNKQTLVETQQLRNSITSEVREK